MKEYTKNLGKVVMTPKGAWSIEKEYEILDIVHDSVTDHAYISKQEVPSGVDLSDSRYWMPLNVSGYSDSNVITLNSFNEDGEIQSYTLEEAIKAIKDVGRKSGAILIFYNNNVNRLDITTGCWEIWQFNSINVYDWENLDAWINIYYNYNKFVGWYAAENVLNKEIPNPDVGCYAFVGNIYNEAFVYRCDIKNQWTKTNQKAQHYIKIVFGNNVSIGANGNWWQDDVDTNIPVSVKGDNGFTPYLRWSKNNQIEYSYDNINWHILSDKFNTNIKIKDYVNTISNLPNNMELGTIYGVGPTYAEDDGEQKNPIYNLYVYTSNGWVNNGGFNSISAGIVQETGNNETVVMSQDAVTRELTELKSEVGGLFKSISLQGTGAIQQYLTMVRDNLPIGAKKIFIYHSNIRVVGGSNSDSAVYLRMYDSSGTRILNQQLQLNNTIVEVPTNAISFSLDFFASVVNPSIVGAEYSVDYKWWFDVSVYEQIMTNANKITEINSEITEINSAIKMLGLDMAEIIPNTTYNQHIHVNGKIISSSNPMYLTDVIPLSVGDIICFYASTLNETVSAITLCEEDGTPIKMIVQGLPSNAKGYFTYWAEENCYVRLSYYNNATIWKIDKSIFKQIMDYYNQGQATENSTFPILHYGIDGDSVTEGNQWSYYMLQKLGGTQHNVGVGSACWSYKQKYNISGDVLLTPQNYTDSDFVGFGGGSDLTTDENIQKWVNNNACTHIEKFIYEVEKGNFSIPDVFIFAMGTNNDTGNGNTNGTVDEAMNPESIKEDIFVDSNGKSLKYTMCGAMRWCIETIKRAFPDCKIFISLPIQRAQYSSNSNYLYPKVLLIKEMAIQMGCQIIDQYGGCGITSAIENDVSPYGPFLRDGLHPNSDGQKLMGAFAAAQVKSMYFAV